MKNLKYLKLIDYLKDVNLNKEITIGFFINQEEGEYVSGSVDDFINSGYKDVFVSYHYHKGGEDYYILKEKPE